MSLITQRHGMLWAANNGGSPTPPTPVLPANTIRCKFGSEDIPAMGDTQTLVDADENIWDIYKSGDDWAGLFESNIGLLEVIAANTTGVVNMGSMFKRCTHLTSVPLLDTSSATNMAGMFYYCTAVESGALALYQQASGQATPPSGYANCFTVCGANAPAGAPIHAEMAQIPSSWGGTGA